MVKKTIDEKIDDLAIAVKSGFEAVDNRFEGVDKRLESFDKRFEGIDKKFEGVNKQFEEVNKKIANLPDKAYLDDKLANLKGDLTVLMRKEDTKLKTLVEILTERKVLTAQDKKKIFALEPFPQAL